ncbi:MAG: hypothetical protein IJV90_05385, partial [Candidatus Methanomethylophilaceae archaeon]|nr:hypothetical protein [Candidatus Methanomethylophilaceae archaeon]
MIDTSVDPVTFAVPLLTMIVPPIVSISPPITTDPLEIEISPEVVILLNSTSLPSAAVITNSSSVIPVGIVKDPPA